MKKSKILLMVLVGVLFAIIFIACSKNNDTINSKNSSSGKPTVSSSTIQPETFAGVRLRWNVAGNHSCQGAGDCGACPGFCVSFGFQQPQELTATELYEGGAHAKITLLSTTELLFEPEGMFDNGNGTVTITDDFYIDQSVSASLNCNSIKVLQGQYTIDYSNSNYGEAVFDVEVN